MTPASESIRELIFHMMQATFGKETVQAVPEGVAVLRTDGRHTLIRIDDARLVLDADAAVT